MSQRTLTILLGLMALVPPVTIVTLFSILPPVAEGTLDCRVTAFGLPDPSIYELKLTDRPKVEPGSIVVTNSSDEAWTHINIWVNGYYQIYDLDELSAGETREYKLDRFVSRFGAPYQLRYNRLSKALIYARMPKGNRATKEFDLLPISGKTPPAPDQ